jgi:hypothetical protein
VSRAGLEPATLCLKGKSSACCNPYVFDSTFAIWWFGWQTGGKVANSALGFALPSSCRGGAQLCCLIRARTQLVDMKQFTNGKMTRHRAMARLIVYSRRLRVRRQLFFWVDDNYFSLSTTTTF